MNLLDAEGLGGGGNRSKDAELAKVMFEGTMQYRKKLKLPEGGPDVDKIKEHVRSTLPLPARPQSADASD
jgi:hypothetical protein